jgi:hypothetical protein
MPSIATGATQGPDNSACDNVLHLANSGAVMDTGGIVNGILKTVGSAVVLAVLTSLWVIFTERGKAFWAKLGKVEGLRSVAVGAGIALVCALGALAGLASIKSSPGVHFGGMYAISDNVAGTILFKAVNPLAGDKTACPSGFTEVAFMRSIWEDNRAGAGTQVYMCVMK